MDWLLPNPFGVQQQQEDDSINNEDNTSPADVGVVEHEKSINEATPLLFFSLANNHDPQDQDNDDCEQQQRVFECFGSDNTETSEPSSFSNLSSSSLARQIRNDVSAFQLVMFTVFVFVPSAVATVFLFIMVTFRLPNNRMHDVGADHAVIALAIALVVGTLVLMDCIMSRCCCCCCDCRRCCDHDGISATTPKDPDQTMEKDGSDLSVKIQKAKLLEKVAFDVFFGP